MVRVVGLVTAAPKERGRPLGSGTGSLPVLTWPLVSFYYLKP